MHDRNSLSTGTAVQVRRATPDDAEAITAVLAAVVAERAFSAIDRPWPVEEQRRYLEALSAREAFHVAEVKPQADAGNTGAGGAKAGGRHETRIVGYQSVDRYSSFLGSMAHVAAVGTFILPEWRGHGIGRALFAATRQFATGAGYRKFVIYVRGSNTAAQAFYSRLGFAPCGRLTRQTVIDGRDDDEVLMEYFLETPAIAGAPAGS
jgi:RimJ/RimL family protein N-acetyltransferase